MSFLLTLLALVQPANDPAVIFAGGQDGYPAYRIPSIVATSKGTLLALAEGRANLSDHAENDIGLYPGFLDRVAKQVGRRVLALALLNQSVDGVDLRLRLRGAETELR